MARSVPLSRFASRVGGGSDFYVRLHSALMPYGFIVLVVSIALAAWFVLASEAALISKIVVAAIFGFGLACYFNWIVGWWIVGLFVLVGLSLFVVLYRAVLEAGWRK